jgi:hypothetical protein
MPSWPYHRYVLWDYITHSKYPEYTYVVD